MTIVQDPLSLLDVLTRRAYRGQRKGLRVVKVQRISELEPLQAIEYGLNNNGKLFNPPRPPAPPLKNTVE